MTSTIAKVVGKMYLCTQKYIFIVFKAETHFFPFFLSSKHLGNFF